MPFKRRRGAGRACLNARRVRNGGSGSRGSRRWTALSGWKLPGVCGGSGLRQGLRDRLGCRQRRLLRRRLGGRQGSLLRWRLGERLRRVGRRSVGRPGRRSGGRHVIDAVLGGRRENPCGRIALLVAVGGRGRGSAVLGNERWRGRGYEEEGLEGR